MSPEKNNKTYIKYPLTFLYPFPPTRGDGHIPRFLGIDFSQGFIGTNIFYNHNYN